MMQMATSLNINVPNSNTESWMPSRPKKHASTIESKSTACGQNFRRIIKMVKHWNHVHSEYLTSYHIEVLAINIFNASVDDLPWSMYCFFKEARKLVAAPLWYELAFADNYLTLSGREEALKRLATAEGKS